MINAFDTAIASDPKLYGTQGIGRVEKGFEMAAIKIK
jgi:hypothetical protein